MNIDIDFEVYKALTAELESEQDSYNDVIRRLLGLQKTTQLTESGEFNLLAHASDVPSVSQMACENLTPF